MINLDILYNIAGVIVLLVILIFVHELGHFLVAKLSGVGVLKFSLGFGPRLFGRKHGETEYIVSAIPLGGYVKLLGESDKDQVSEEDQKRSFVNQKVSKRICIIAAGPVFNFLFAILVFWLIYMIGVPVMTTEIGGIQKGSVAEKAGFRENDRITSIDGRQVTTWNDIANYTTKSEGRELVFKFRRGDQEEVLRVKPQLTKVQNPFGEDIESYKIGITPTANTFIKRENPIRAAWSGLEQTWYISELTVLSLFKMIEGVISPKTLGGPILIAQMAGAQVKKGAVSFIFLMGLLSINLAILNLLPIPVLDGGHLFFSLIELITGREVNVKWREIAQQIGFVLLIMLMLFVIYNDLVRIYPSN